MWVKNFENKYLENLFNLVKNSFKKPVAIVLSFPHNPTTATVSLEFFKEVVAFAKSKDIWLIVSSEPCGLRTFLMYKFTTS